MFDTNYILEKHDKMKQRRIVTLVIIVILIIVTSCIPTISSNDNSESGDSYYFEDVNVLIFGRSRSIYSDDTWHGGLFVGQQKFCGVMTINKSLERLTILLRNQSSGEFFFKSRLRCHHIGMMNVTGVFFWGAIGSGTRIIPPIVFIICHADLLGIRPLNYSSVGGVDQKFS